MDSNRRIAELEDALVAKDKQIAALQAQQAQAAGYEQQILALNIRLDQQARQIADLQEKLGQNSSNSHLPPSSDGPGQRQNRNKDKKDRKKSKRKRGAQKGHPGRHRELLPSAQVDEFINLYPDRCENCWEPLSEGEDPNAIRHQVTEVPPIQPHTTEYRRHAVTCECGHTTRAKDDEVPASSFGPRLMSMIALLTGVYHLSRRKTVTLLSDMVGVRISLGGVSGIEGRVSEAVNPAVEQAWEYAQKAPVKHTDATGWLKAGVTHSLWTIATTMVTVFKILINGKADTIRPLFGTRKGILISDRATVFGFWSMKRRQICFAHLLRKFISFSERDGPAHAIGDELLNLTGLIFEYWHNYKDGKLTKSLFHTWMVPVRWQFESVLERAAAAGIDRLSGSCADILEHRLALWTFVDRAGVEPTNNHAEQQLRAFVLWRKRSFGAQSDRGNRFAERIMTVAHTARKQDVHVLDFLTTCCEAQIANTPPPTLLAAA